ncbi:hypothetical protein HYC85_032224 [Camellia sinensis]|uniref:Serine-threonine/tyrosine-protein kinase catalytic domain-containing protein n=1 Tax=Camellia sinensis TaxID=4442 RepID=A0A7J7FTL2_CAMSI|nr:hypothetical protein HYC85_032224 [Camellia sinensis]
MIGKVYADKWDSGATCQEMTGSGYGAQRVYKHVCAPHTKKRNTLYDYSGYGQSSRKPSEHNTYADIEAVGPTLDLAARLPHLRAVVLHSPILSGLRVMYPVKRTYWFDIYKNIEKIPYVNCPVLIIHGVATSKKDGFSLSSGDFPTLGSEKDNSGKSRLTRSHVDFGGVYTDYEMLKDVLRFSRQELKVACEDFCNIIGSSPDSLVYKGTMKGGPEIAIISLCIKEEHWTGYLELFYQREVADLARLNHENTGKLLGYCTESKPFTRMLVFEYASDGTLYEHLHCKSKACYF